jgi:hypothetical protein
MSNVEEPIARLGTWLTDVMRLAGREDAMISPEAEKRTEILRVSLTIDKRELVVYCSPTGHIEIVWAIPGLRDCFRAYAQTNQDSQTLMPVRMMLFMIKFLKVN